MQELQQKYENHPLPAVIVSRGCLCLGAEIENSLCSWCAGNMSPLACRRETVVTCSRAIYPTVAPLQVRACLIVRARAWGTGAGVPRCARTDALCL